MKMHLVFVLPVLLCCLPALPVAAMQPWKPKISIPLAERLGRVQPALNRQKMRQFQQVYALGLRALRYGQYRQAQQRLSEALRLLPDHIGARLARLRVLMALGYLTWNRSLVRKAQSDARHVLHIDPSSGEAQALQKLVEELAARMEKAARRRAKTKPKKG